MTVAVVTVDGPKADITPFVGGAAGLLGEARRSPGGEFVPKWSPYFVYRQNVDFVDAYVAAVMERDQIDEVYSLDRKHISRLKTVRRKEP